MHDVPFHALQSQTMTDTNFFLSLKDWNSGVTWLSHVTNEMPVKKKLRFVMNAIMMDHHSGNKYPQIINYVKNIWKDIENKVTPEMWTTIANETVCDIQIVRRVLVTEQITTLPSMASGAT